MLHVFPPAYKPVSHQNKVVADEQTWLPISKYEPVIARDIILLRDKLIYGGITRSIYKFCYKK